MHKPELAPLIEKNYVVVRINVGKFDQNRDVAKKYGVPLERGSVRPRRPLLGGDKALAVDAEHRVVVLIVPLLQGIGEWPLFL